MNIAQIKSRLKEGVEDCYKTIGLNPKYEKAYQRAAKIYLLQNQVVEAKKIIELGRRHLPFSPLLISELKNIEKVLLYIIYVYYIS